MSVAFAHGQQVDGTLIVRPRQRESRAAAHPRGGVQTESTR